jgi:hypothetical protein
MEERTSMVTINDPAILAEVSVAFDAYEVALMTNDIEAMDALFWHSPLTVRYGAGDAQYGIDEIREFRKARAGGSPQRQVVRRSVTTFGPHFAATNIEFIREDSPAIGRQSQSWTKFPEGWRIVSAHVSLTKGGA